MDIKNEILFKSTTFLGLNELIKFWNKDKPRIIHAKKDNVRSRIQKWKKKNPNKKLTDKVYEKFLTTRNATSVILYKNKYYKPKILFKAKKRTRCDYSLSRFPCKNAILEKTKQVINTFRY